MNIIASVVLWIVYIVSLYFSVFLFLVYLDHRRSIHALETVKTGTADRILREESLRQEGSLRLQSVPKVSIIIPAYNEEKTILKTLHSVYDLSYPSDKIEVIAIDDGSKDGTLEVMRQFAKDKKNMVVISHKNKGKAASLNSGIEISTGEFFACLDADSFVHPLTLQKMMAMYDSSCDPRLAVITPAMKVYKPLNLLQKVQWLEYLVIILIARLSSEMDALYVAPGPFSVYRTSVVRDIGGFDEKILTEDQEIAYRLQKHHYRIKQCPDGYVYTTTPSTFKAFYRQRRRWYLGGMVCASRYKEMIANREYGDFGVMQMVKNVLGYAFALIGIGFGLYLFLNPFYHYVRTLMLVHFDVLPYITNLKWKFTFLTFLTVDFRKGFLVLFLMIIGYFLFWASLRNAKEKASAYGWFPMIPYFAYYYTLKAFILVGCAITFARGKKVKW